MPSLIGEVVANMNGFGCENTVKMYIKVEACLNIQRLYEKVWAITWSQRMITLNLYPTRKGRPIEFHMRQESEPLEELIGEHKRLAWLPRLDFNNTWASMILDLYTLEGEKHSIRIA